MYCPWNFATGRVPRCLLRKALFCRCCWRSICICRTPDDCATPREAIRGGRGLADGQLWELRELGASWERGRLEWGKGEDAPA